MEIQRFWVTIRLCFNDVMVLVPLKGLEPPTPSLRIVFHPRVMVLDETA